jgi:DNA-binding transcriptional regulator YdaS (Cro superfamily)
MKMTPAQFRIAIDKFGLSQTRAAEFFGYSPRQGQRWALGETEIPVAVAYLIAEMIRHKVTPEELIKRHSKK